MSEPVVIASQELAAAIDPMGAELVSLTDTAGRRYMSDGDPAWWTGRAPLLFPIVGELRGGTYRLDGRDRAMARHGFARRSVFALAQQAADKVVFRLVDSEATHAAYPFAFALEMAFALAGDTLHMTATVTNAGSGPMPFSFGYHPAFAWPLPGGGDKLAHDIVFQHDEPHDIWRLDAAGLVASDERSPVRGDRFALHPDLFEDDAMIWDHLASRRLQYRGMNGVALEIAFPDTPYLGIWQKPGAPFICIEPWAGLADDTDFNGDFRDKRGVMELAPGASRSFRMDVTVRHG